MSSFIFDAFILTLSSLSSYSLNALLNASIIVGSTYPEPPTPPALALLALGGFITFNLSKFLNPFNLLAKASVASPAPVSSSSISNAISLTPDNPL